MLSLDLSGVSLLSLWTMEQQHTTHFSLIFFPQWLPGGRVCLVLSTLLGETKIWLLIQLSKKPEYCPLVPLFSFPAKGKVTTYVNLCLIYHRPFGAVARVQLFFVLSAPGLQVLFMFWDRWDIPVLQVTPLKKTECSILLSHWSRSY